MRIAFLYGPFCLSFRKDLNLTDPFNDPRGLSGSELGVIRLAQECAELGHEVSLFTLGAGVSRFGNVEVYDINNATIDTVSSLDAVVSINEPDLLRSFPRASFRVAEMWLNDVTFCKAGFEDNVDLFVSPSEPHRQKFLTDPSWHRVEVTPEHPGGKATFTPNPDKWVALELGCDPELYEGVEEIEGRDVHCVFRKVPGRVVYCSSPDRGLHWLLQEWPAIKRAVPHASLRIFYHVRRWIQGFDNVPYYPPIEPLRARAMYVNEALQRLRGLDVEVVDSVSRNRLIRELCQAECLAYPVDTTSWSEGFSCSILEACAARACPVVFDTDAIGEVYQGAAIVHSRRDLVGWRDSVIQVLQDADVRELHNRNARALAEKLTWRRHAERLCEEIERRM